MILDNQIIHTPMSDPDSSDQENSSSSSSSDESEQEEKHTTSSSSNDESEQEEKQTIKKRTKGVPQKSDYELRIVFDKPAKLKGSHNVHKWRRLEKDLLCLTSDGCLLANGKASNNVPIIKHCYNFFNEAKRIPKGEVLSQRCKVKNCVNPNHIIVEKEIAHEKRMKCDGENCKCDPKCIKIKNKEQEILDLRKPENSHFLHSSVHGHQCKILKKLNKKTKMRLRKERKEIRDAAKKKITRKRKRKDSLGSKKKAKTK